MKWLCMNIVLTEARSKVFDFPMIEMESAISGIRESKLPQGSSCLPSRVQIEDGDIRPLVWRKKVKSVRTRRSFLCGDDTIDLYKVGDKVKDNLDGSQLRNLHHVRLINTNRADQE